MMLTSIPFEGARKQNDSHSLIRMVETKSKRLANFSQFNRHPSSIDQISNNLMHAHNN